MGAFENLEPKEVFTFFEKICGIPHGSGNVERISDYLAEFARERKLEYYQDETKNVIIIKEATPGYEAEEPLILQGHIDMVAVKKPESDIDMKEEGLRIAVDGDWAYAKDTSLGGDDGIAVAYGLALLDSDSIAHPRLEVIFTVDEETGMDGARAIDLSMLKGRRMLNLDSEEEGIFLSSCAGGARVNCHIPVERTLKGGIYCKLTVGGLQGGHSGEMIDKERGNSNVLAGRVLYEASEGESDICLISINGGLADNAIPRETVAELLVPEKSLALFEQKIRETGQEIEKELAVKDPGFRIDITKGGYVETEVLEENSFKRVAQALLIMPSGVQAMSADVEGLVETSLNMGILRTMDVQDAPKSEVSMHFSVRSSVESSKRNLLHKLCTITEMAGGTCDVAGEYPGWAFRRDSALRDKMVSIYTQMYGEAPKIRAIHAGLECGLLSAKLPNLDCVSIGPDMQGIHTAEERLSISSVKRVWDFVVEVVRRK